MVVQDQNIGWRDPNDASVLLQMLDKYPWFAAARVKLCRLAASSSGPEAAGSLFEEGIAYFPDGTYVARSIFPMPAGDYGDASLKRQEELQTAAPVRPWACGMDYFSREDYAGAAQPLDSALSSIAVVDYSSPAPQPCGHREEEFDLATETLAKIYADQGYLEQAREIYRKLILHSPEKSAYFASLLKEIEQ